MHPPSPRQGDEDMSHIPDVYGIPIYLQSYDEDDKKEFFDIFREISVFNEWDSSCTNAEDSLFDPGQDMCHGSR
jgi:hypothetical protein